MPVESPPVTVCVAREDALRLLSLVGGERVLPGGGMTVYEVNGTDYRQLGEALEVALAEIAANDLGR